MTFTTNQWGAGNNYFILYLRTVRDNSLKSRLADNRRIIWAGSTDMIFLILSLRGRGVYMCPIMEIDFIVFSQRGEWDLLSAFYLIEKYWSKPQLLQVKGQRICEILLHTRFSITIHRHSLLFGPILDIPKFFNDGIDEEMIEKSVARTHGASRPSNINGHFFRQICSYQEKASLIKQNIATLARKIASKPLDPHSLESFTSCRLIPLDKNHGLWLFGTR